MVKTTNSPADDYALYRVTLDIAIPIYMDRDRQAITAIDFIDAVGDATVLGSYEESLCLMPARTVARSVDKTIREATKRNYPPHND
tara:strand:- start:1630 stop:1887 length:258 start_codon:yes stop_codon:yes gene_type:complete